MKCPRCEAEISNTTTFCTRCEASMAPVAAHASASYQATPMSFSYLPAGTPPWPSTVPQRHPSQTDQLAHTQIAQDTDNLSSARKNPVGRVLRSVVLLLFICLLGVGGTAGVIALKESLPPSSDMANKSSNLSQASSEAAATATSQASSEANATATPGAPGQLPKPTSYSTASNADVNLSLQYPSNWTVDPPQKSPDAVILTLRPQPNLGVGALLFSHFSDATSATINNADELNQQTLEIVSKDATNIQAVAPSNAAPTIAGTNWKESDETCILSNGLKVHLTSITVQHGKDYYNIIFLTLNAVHSEVLQTYIQPILNSLHFIQ